MAQASRNGQPWTADDLQELRRLAASGVDAREIAAALDRTTIGVKSKALSLRLALAPRRVWAAGRAGQAESRELRTAEPLANPPV